jgi:metallo-beta-lactamase class B
VGVNSLKADFLKERGLSADCRRKYLESLDKVENQQVDITVGNHVGQNDTVGKLSRLGTEKDNPFVDPTEWKRFIEKCRNNLEKLNLEDPC